MQSPPKLKYLVISTVTIELLIFGVCFFLFEEIGEVFRHAARYSGRFSFIIYLLVFFHFANNANRLDAKQLQKHKKGVTVFCLAHFIHLFFLGSNVYLNEIQLVPYKVAAGVLAYLLILIYPILVRKNITTVLRLSYFYYLGIIIAFTYVARIKGEFEGVTPNGFHYVGLGTIIIAFIVFSWMTLIRKND